MKNPLQTFQRITTTIDNGNAIISSAEIIIKGDSEDRKLYDISKVNQSWIVKSYDKDGKFQTIKTTETDSTIPDFIKGLVKKFDHGRILSSSIRKGWYTYRTCENAFAKKLSRQQVQSILRYERDGTPTSIQPPAVSQANPSLLQSTQIFDDYAIETWPKGEKKRGYYYTTFNPTTKKHLDKLIFKY